MEQRPAQMTANGKEVPARISECPHCSRHTLAPLGGSEWDLLQRKRVTEQGVEDAEIVRTLRFDFYPCAWCGKFDPDEVKTTNERVVSARRDDIYRTTFRTLPGCGFIALIMWGIVAAGVVKAVGGERVPILSWIMYPSGALLATLFVVAVIRNLRRTLAEPPLTSTVAELNADDRQAYWLQFAGDMLALRCDPTGRPVKGSDDPNAPRPWRNPA